MRCCCIVALLPFLAPAQELRVRSEFQRVGADGQVIAQDQTGRPREILSPPLARNAFNSFFVTLELPANTDYFLDVGLNPENAVRIVFYKQFFNPNGIPDRLEKVASPVQGKTGDKPEFVTYWMDVFVEAGAPVRRIKIEPQLWVHERWIVYPMEARVQQAEMPNLNPQFWGLPAPESRSDTAIISPWRDHLCRPLKDVFKPTDTSIRLLQQRNALQDVALAKKLGKDAVIQALVNGGIAAENAVPDQWCSLAVDSWRAELPVEWYLKVRDSLYRRASSN